MVVLGGNHGSNNQTTKKVVLYVVRTSIWHHFDFIDPKMATTREPAIPAEDEREILSKGIPGVDSAIAKQPILGSYMPTNPVHQYTFKKWDLGDWGRQNENKYFQANRDRDAAIT